MRRAIVVTVLALASLLELAGCGTPFSLPTETRNRQYSTDKSYQIKATWTGMDGIADLLLTQGIGSQLFLLFQRPGVGTAPRGEVSGYAIKARPPSPSRLPGIDFLHLFNPHALCASGGRIFVLDQGDTSLARDPDPQRRVSDLSVYWRVREYGLLGGDTTTTFTDTSFAYVQGIAADDQGRVYVSGSAIVLVPDAQDPRILTRLFQYRIRRYLRVAPGSVTPDPYMPGTDRWVRDLNYIVEDGSGLGTLTDPRGIYWSTATGPALFAADLGKGWIQKLSDYTSSTAFFKIDAGQDSVLIGPQDVAVDLLGFIYVADTDNRRVLRYDPFGQFVQRVNVETDADHLPLNNPVAVAADDSLVFVADRALGRVVRYERRK
jgi:sugar lactone lactonase YvrE